MEASINNIKLTQPQVDGAGERLVFYQISLLVFIALLASVFLLVGVFLLLSIFVASLFFMLVQFSLRAFVSFFHIICFTGFFFLTFTNFFFAGFFSRGQPFC